MLLSSLSVSASPDRLSHAKKYIPPQAQRPRPKGMAAIPKIVVHPQPTAEEERRAASSGKVPGDTGADVHRVLHYGGDTVLDPMVGTGSTLVACLRSGRNGIGIELSEEYAAIARQAVAAEQAGLGSAASAVFAHVIDADCRAPLSQSLPPTVM